MNGQSSNVVNLSVDTLEANTDGLEALVTTTNTYEAGPTTATQTSVDSATTAGGVAILASTAGRRGATITNTDANALYLFFGATGTVSSSAYNVQLLTGQTLVLEPGEYTGAICGIWAADGSGAAKVCQFTA